MTTWDEKNLIGQEMSYSSSNALDLPNIMDEIKPDSMEPECKDTGKKRNANAKTTEQFIAEAHEIHGHRYDYSKVEYETSLKKIEVICKKHGSFFQNPCKHLSGQNCPICSGNVRRTTDEFCTESRKIHGDKYDYSLVDYKNLTIRVLIICPIHGKFSQLPQSHLRGMGCRKCADELRTSTTEEFISGAIKIHGEKYDYSKSKYVGRNDRLEIVCPHHGSFFQSPHAHLYGRGCEKCAVDATKSSTEEFISSAIKIHGNMYDYSKVEYVRTNTPVEIVCKKHGSFLQIPNSHLNGSGCLHCAHRYTEAEFIVRASYVHKNKYDYSRAVYKTGEDKLEIICPKHGSFFQRAGSHCRGHACPKCTHVDSKDEKRFLDYVGIPKSNRHIRVGRHTVDGLDGHIIYEFLGDYWHGNPETTNHVEINKNTKLTFGELYKKTFDRFDILRKLGYELKYIWENDWKQFKKNLVESPNILTYNPP